MAGFVFVLIVLELFFNNELFNKNINLFWGFCLTWSK